MSAATITIIALMWIATALCFWALVKGGAE